MKAADLGWSWLGLTQSFISSEEAGGREKKNFLFLLIEIRFYAGTKWKGNFGPKNVVIQFQPENIVSFYILWIPLISWDSNKEGKN